MSANTNLQIANLDFDAIKQSFKNYLRKQDVLKDYDYDGSALSTLLDVMAYNTQYNAFYLNMVANEIFLDSAVQRASVVSQAKLLNYVPKSAVAPTAYINVVVHGVTDASLTLPQYTKFITKAIDNVNYTFVTNEQTTVNVVDNTATFSNVEIKQAVVGSFSYTADTLGNPSSTFDIPDPNVDLSTLTVHVYESSSNTSYQVYNRADNFLSLRGNDAVYFVQEGNYGNYQIYFGDGVLGKKLNTGNYIRISYLSTKGSMAAGANSFQLMDTIGGFGTTTITPILAATKGNDRESIDSIKFQAPKAYSAQKRAVSKNDYITAIQQNNIGISFDAVNVWGGEENDPPVYGQVFVCMKPSGAYDLTTTQKQKIIGEIIQPVSILTVSPTIIDPDYTYLKISTNVYFDPTKTTKTAAQIQTGIKDAIRAFGANTLNTFNSTFNAYEMLSVIQNYDQSVISSEFSVQLQKKFLPNFSSATSYKLLFNVPLERGLLVSGVSSTPALQYKNPTNAGDTINGVFIQEVPVSTSSVNSISVLNPGFGYQKAPTITILGDGSGAKAYAIMKQQSISSIVVTDSGTGYTSALVKITPADGDTTGQLASAVVNLQGNLGTLETYYESYDPALNGNIKTVLNTNIGTIDYAKGIITLNSFNPIGIDTPIGNLTIAANPSTTIISSSYNRIITIDPYDANAITVNIVAKTNK